MSSVNNDPATQKNNQSNHSTQDALRDTAIQEGTQQLNTDDVEEVNLKFTDSEVKMSYCQMWCMKKN